MNLQHHLQQLETVTDCPSGFCKSLNHTPMTTQFDPFELCLRRIVLSNVSPYLKYCNLCIPEDEPAAVLVSIEVISETL